MRTGVVALVLSGTAASAQPRAVQACVEASEAGQLELQRGALLPARRAFERCSDAACPAVVQAECTRGLEQVLAAMPSLNIVARLHGEDRGDANVWLDGVPWFSVLDGKPRELEPGDHLVTVEVKGARQERRLVVVQGEKNRVVVFDLARPLAAPEPPPRPPPAPVAETSPAPRSAAWPVALSSTAVLGVAGFVTLGLTGTSALERLLAQPCAATRTCDPAAVSAIQRQLVGADVALGLGVVSAALAAWAWWRWSDAPPPVTPALTVSGAATAVGVTGRW